MNDIDLRLNNTEWVIQESKKILIQYKKAKTDHQRNRLIPTLKHLISKLYFERNETNKLIDKDQSEEWKNI